MRFGSVCSGIEAASVAWHGLGWEPAWLAEVDVAAANVLSHRLGATAPRFPLPKTETAIAKMRWGDRVTNWGDMTKLPDLVRTGEAEAPDVFCGGCPCQSFSLAGLRRGLDDTRGNLTLTFVEIANEIDLKRAENGDEPCIIFYENVPGLLSDKTNAFGCFLAGLAGEDVPLEPSGKRWSDAGCVVGPQRTVAWRSLDAQYFGLAQRRERVFVVASAREGFDPVEILLEFDGLRRDSAPSREAWEETAGTLDARSTGGGFPGTDGACSGHDVPAERPGRAVGLAPAIAIQERAVADTNCGPGGKGWREDDCAYTLEARHHSQYVAYEAVPQWWDGSPVSQTLDAVLHKGQTMPEKNRFPAVLQPIPFDTTQITSPSNYSNPKPGAPCHPLAAGAHVPAIAFSSKDYGADAAEELAPTMRAMGHKDSHPNAGGQLAVCVTGDRTHALNTANNGKGCSEDGTGRGVPTVAGYFEVRNGDAYQADASSLLSTLRQAVGQKAYVEWGIAVLAAFRSPEILRSWLHGASLRSETEKVRRRLDDSALSCTQGVPGDLLRQVWEHGPDGRTSQGRGLAKQLAGKPGEALSVLSHQGTSDSYILRSLREASEGVRLLFQALSEVHQVGRSETCHAQRESMSVRRLMPVEAERLQGFLDRWTAVPTTPVSTANQAKAREAMEAGDPSFCEIDGAIFNVAADGPRYKQLGNSWAVPVVAWIGARIDRHVRALDSRTVAATLDPATIAWIIAA